MMLIPAGCAEVYDGPYIIEGDVEWANVTYVLNDTVLVNETASLTIVNSTIVPAHPLGKTYMIQSYGRLAFSGSTLEGGRWYSIVFSAGDVMVEDSGFSNCSYAMIAGGNVSVSGSSLSDLEYGIRSSGDLLTVNDTVFTGCTFPFQSYADTTVMRNVTFVNTTYTVGSVYSDVAELTGITIITAAEGFILSGAEAVVQLIAEDISESNCGEGCSAPAVTGSAIVLMTADLELNDSRIEGSDVGILAYHGNVDVDNTTFEGLLGGLYGYNLKGNVTDSLFIDCAVGLEASRSDVVFKNSTFVNTTPEVRQWMQVRVNVEDPYGSDVRSAIVTIVDSVDNTTEFATNSAGYAMVGLVSSQSENGTVSTFGPYDITVEKDGIETSRTDVDIEDDDEIDFVLPYWKPDLNITTISASPGRKVVINVTIVNDGDQVAENVTVGFTYKAGIDVRVIDTVAVGDIAVNEEVFAEMVWDTSDLGISEGEEIVITAIADARNAEAAGVSANNDATVLLTMASEGDEDDVEPNPVLVSLIVLMLVLIALLILKFRKRIRSSHSEEGPGGPETWNEVSKNVRKHRRESFEDIGRAPARRTRKPPMTK
jgi:hypothetical protein